MLLIRVQHLARREVLIVRRRLHLALTHSSYQRHTHRLQDLRLHRQMLARIQRLRQHRHTRLYVSPISPLPTLHRTQLGRHRAVELQLRALVQHFAHRQGVDQNRGIAAVQRDRLLHQLQATSNTSVLYLHRHLHLWKGHVWLLTAQNRYRNRLLRSAFLLQRHRLAALAQQSAYHSHALSVHAPRAPHQHSVQLGHEPSRSLAVVHHNRQRVQRRTELLHRLHMTLQ